MEEELMKLKEWYEKKKRHNYRKHKEWLSNNKDKVRMYAKKYYEKNNFYSEPTLNQLSYLQKK